MSSITKAQRARLGMFLTVFVVALVILLAIPLGVHLNSKEKTFFAHFTGESLSGLEESAPVKFHGVPIGKVGSIRYDPADLSRVTVVLKVRKDFPMKKDMYVQSWAMGITGLNYLDILGGTNASPLLPPNSEIPTRVSLLTNLSGKVEVITEKVELLLNHLNTILAPDSVKSVKKVLDNLVVITADMKEFFNHMSPNVEKMTGSARQAMSRIDSISQDVHSLTRTINASFSKNQLGIIMSHVDSTTRSIKALSETMLLMVKQSREDFGVSMQNLREAMENANQLTKVLSENPSLLIRGETQKDREVK
jgi:phospholipid/cholesterol/gamma-HCH transport system substrate-binding protein